MRSTEVSDLKWPQLTLTLIWRNVKVHIQSCIDTNLINYPHSSQSHHAKLRLLTISLKSCEGCSSYDVITSWPDLTRPNFFERSLRSSQAKVTWWPKWVILHITRFAWPRRTYWYQSHVSISFWSKVIGKWRLVTSGDLKWPLEG